MNISKTYYSKINITSSFSRVHLEEKQKTREIFSIPKPYYKNEHFMTHPAGEQIYQGKAIENRKLNLNLLKGLKKALQITNYCVYVMKDHLIMDQTI